MNWNAKALETLKAHLADGLSYAKIGKAMGCSRVAVAGAVRRYIHKIPDERLTHGPRKLNGYRSLVRGHWTEEGLTETWAERKARQASQ